VKPAVPGEIVNPGGGFEEDDGRARSGRRLTSYELRQARDLEIVEPANESAFEALGEKIFHHFHDMSLSLRDGAKQSQRTCKQEIAFRLHGSYDIYQSLLLS
jgi:hypothetical protein